MNKKIIREIAPGGGLVTPWTLISREASVGVDSRAYDSAEVLDRAILQGESVIRDFAKIMERAVMKDSVLREYARVGGSAYVLRSAISGVADVRGDTIIEESEISGAALITGRAVVSDSKLSSNIRVMDQASLINVVTSGDVNDTYVIGGNVRLHFDVPNAIYPGTRVERGYWHRPPFVIPTLFHVTSEDVDDKVRIGCISHSVEHWFKHGKEILLGFGLDEKLYPQFEEAMVKMRDHKKEYGSPTTRRNKG